MIEFFYRIFSDDREVPIFSNSKLIDLEERLDKCKENYIIDVVESDRFSIFVTEKDSAQWGNVCSVGGYYHLEDAIESVLTIIE